MDRCLLQLDGFGSPLDAPAAGASPVGTTRERRSRLVKLAPESGFPGSVTLGEICMTANLNLGMIGNGQISSLLDERGRHVWTCFPRFDGDPVFCGLLRPEPVN